MDSKIYDSSDPKMTVTIGISCASLVIFATFSYGQ